MIDWHANWQTDILLWLANSDYLGPEEVLASFELSIIVDGNKCNFRDSKKVCQFAEEHHPAWGFKKFIQFDELQNEEKGYLKGGVAMVLNCSLGFMAKQ